MAEKRFIKGLFKDTGNIDQPEGSWRHAKNMIINDKKGSISNEGGNETFGHLGTDITFGNQNDKVIGKIEVNDDKVILFITDVVSVTPSSEIGIWENGTYTPIFNPNIANPDHDLNFRESNPIEGTFKIDSKGDLVLYWTDDLNPPRAFNVDRQLRDSTSISNLYGIASLNHIDILNLFPYSGAVPHIYIESFSPNNQTAVQEGGGLRTGAYYLALAYVDEDFVATNFLTVSNPIPIVDEFDSTRPTTKKDGIKEGSQTSKSISWNITNMNLDYKYLKPVVIRKMGKATEAFKLNDVAINPNSSGFQRIIFSGIEGFESASVEDIIIDTVSYDTAKTIQQLDGVLYLGNLTGTKDVGYQKYANNIKLNSKTRSISDFDEYWATVDNLITGFNNSEVDEGNYVDHGKSYRYLPNIFKYKGYMRDETYSFYIAFIMKDGSMSYAYHIPGRGKLEDQDYTHYNVLGGFTAQDETDKIPTTYRNLYREDAKLYQFYDLSSNVSGTNITAAGNSRHMQYWENFTELYPNTDDYEVWDEFGQISGASGSIQGTNVRHHHFPSNENEDRKTIKSNNSIITPTTSQWIQPSTIHFTGEYRVCVDNGSSGAFWMNDSWSDTLNNVGRVRLRGTINAFNPTNPNNIIPPHNNSLRAFVATSPNTQVEVRAHFRMHNDSVWCGQYGYIRVYVQKAGVTSVVPLDAGVNPSCPDDFVSPVHANALGVVLSTAGIVTTTLANKRVVDSGGYAWTISNLDPGDSVWMQGYGTQLGNGGCVAGGSTSRRVEITTNCTPVASCVYNTSGSWAQFRVQIIPPSANDYNDVKVSHDVDLLGFELEDLKIPQSIADEVQGFRIYRSKREHSNKTIVGQSVGIPMENIFGVPGICSEASGNPDAIQGLQTLGVKEESFYLNSAYSKDASIYTLNINTVQNNQGIGYKIFSFHDFHMLRTHNSLAPVTHIKAEYIVGDYTWNGPDINQDKKMLTEIDTTSTVSDSGAYKVKERWGWDLVGSAQNCYPKEINNALFIGGRYMSTGDTSISGHNMHTLNYELNRPLGQKAKSYILGDSIFDGNSLGFGGKISNLFGESHIAFGIRDGYELPALTSLMDLDGSGGTTNSFNNIWGIYNEDYAYMLTTLTLADITTDTAARHKSYILNLKAFKTDLYKSIDSNELVWTGFEVLGDNLNYYVFDEDTGLPIIQLMPGGTPYQTANTYIEGIWGGDTFVCRYGLAKGVTPMSDQQESTPEKGIYYHIIESPDNINFRHSDSVETSYFPLTPAKILAKYVGTEDNDYTHQDKMLYNDNYSAVNDIAPVFPLPLRIDEQTDFPTRAHRSAKNDTTSLIDNYRVFLANQFKDLPKNRGDLWKLSSFNNLLYFHMEESLFAAKGKQSMSMSDGSQAYVGSGDIFEQDPDEVIQTQDGFGGTQSQWAALTTRHGYFFVDRDARKVFLMKDKLAEISNLGLETWFRENLGFALLEFGYDIACSIDNPILGFGMHAVWDPKYKRILLTKRDLEPTTAFITGYNIPTSAPPTFGEIYYSSEDCKYKRYVGCHTPPCPNAWEALEWDDETYFTKAGWTISYYPEIGIWGSFHDYVPYIYFNTSLSFYSLTDQYPRPCSGLLHGTNLGNAGIWKHNSNRKGLLYQRLGTTWASVLNYHPFEFEFIHNETKGMDTLASSFNYTAEVFNASGVNVLQHGFTKFFLYNTFQISADIINVDGVTGEGTDLQYLVNTRRVGNNWKVNNFRDMSALATDTSSYYMQGTVTNPNIIGGTNAGTITTSSTQSMFTVDGMSKNINAGYLDLAKSWDQQRKFIDKWIGIRLIYDNISNNLLNLYSTNVGVRKMNR